MADSLLQQQLDEMRALLDRARDLFGTNVIAPPDISGSIAEQAPSLGL